MPSRRAFYRFGSSLIGGAIGIGLAIPGVAFLLDPLRRGGGGSALKRELTRLGQLTVGKPQAFPIIAERQDAWVKHPPEPVGTVWLIRQPEGTTPPVVAFTAECPHLGCLITADEGGFVCPCHRAEFDLSGKKRNAVSPRGMDTLEVELSKDDDPVVTVLFQRFRTQAEEKIPLV
ncbi:MAG: Rieske 2Fe-2S domain-containing protein [Isosphaeraceae bacterium]